MDRVLSIQASRRIGQDGETFITKRMCFSFLFSIGFLTLLGGFLLGRYSLDRELEIKRKQLDYERRAHSTRHGSYSDALDRFSDALRNLTSTTDEVFDAVHVAETRSNGVELDRLWQILRCRHAAAVDARAHGGDVRSGVESMLAARLNALTECLRSGRAYVLNGTT